MTARSLGHRSLPCWELRCSEGAFCRIPSSGRKEPVSAGCGGKGRPYLKSMAGFLSMLFRAKYRLSDSTADEITQETFLKRRKRKPRAGQLLWMNSFQPVKTTTSLLSSSLRVLQPSEPLGLRRTTHRDRWVGQVHHAQAAWRGAVSQSREGRGLPHNPSPRLGVHAEHRHTGKGAGPRLT